MAAGEEIIGKAEHMKVLLIEWMRQKDGPSHFYSFPRYNLNGGGVGEIEGVTRRRAWRELDYWQSDSILSFEKPVLTQDGFCQNEFLYIGRSSPGVLTVKSIFVVGTHAMYFSVSQRRAIIKENEHIRVKVSFCSPRPIHSKQLKAFIHVVNNVNTLQKIKLTGQPHQLISKKFKAPQNSRTNSKKPTRPTQGDGQAQKPNVTSSTNMILVQPKKKKMKHPLNKPKPTMKSTMRLTENVETVKRQDMSQNMKPIMKPTVKIDKEKRQGMPSNNDRKHNQQKKQQGTMSKPRGTRKPNSNHSDKNRIKMMPTMLSSMKKQQQMPKKAKPNKNVKPKRTPRAVMPKPTKVPTNSPSSFPSATPTQSHEPSISQAPSATPTMSQAPSSSPSSMPSSTPSSTPSDSPTLSAIPSSQPSGSPSSIPSRNPSSSPSSPPSAVPSPAPSASPSHMPSSSPSLMPSAIPSSSPSDFPSGAYWRSD